MSASTSDTSIGSHEVFISHRGVGMKLGFANRIYYALKDRGISAFLDMESLPKGDDVRNYMLEAARRATIHVPIFTKDYGNSEWCLDELAIIMESKRNYGGKVFPVFYDVKPDDLRKPDEPFGKHLEPYLQNLQADLEKLPAEERHIGQKRIDGWRVALEEASWLNGFWMDTYGRRDGELIQALVVKIENEIIDSLRVDTVPDAVGLEVKVKDLVQKFCLHEKTKVYVVLLWGMGGIGKTTLARAMYHAHRKDFEEASFIENCATKSSIRIQDRLRLDLLRDSSDMSEDLAKGRARLKHGVSQKKVLIVLDDMTNHFKCVEDVIEPTSLCTGSRILVTSRDQRVFPNENSFSIAFQGNKYELQQMVYQESWQLFCLHAFKRSNAPPDFQELAKKVVDACDGVPLALEVLGRHLSTLKKKVHWEEAIKKLRDCNHEEIKDKLMISYDALDPNEQHMFLDVACFLIEEDEQKAEFYWDGYVEYYNSGLEKLIQLCLVKVDPKERRFSMHDLLRDLGRSKSRDTRFWDVKDVKQLPDSAEDLEKIIGLSTSSSLTSLPASLLSKMKNLRLLFLKGTELTGLKKLRGVKVRWLKWDNCPHETLPKPFSSEFLIVLELQV